MIKSLKKENGITMVTLVVTILLLTIISSIIVFNVVNGVKLDKLNKMYSDLQIIQDKIDIYYVENGELPIVEGSDKQSLSDIDTTVNDNDSYHLIDLEELGINSSDLNDYVSNNYYVNDESHVVYSLKGTEFEGKTYYRLNKEYQEIDD